MAVKSVRDYVATSEDVDSESDFYLQDSVSEGSMNRIRSGAF